MLGFKFRKAPPTTYVMQFEGGRVKREGAGLSMFYFAPTTTLVEVPFASADLPFAFQETTSDFQTVTIQGQLTYRVAQPKTLATLLDYTVDSDGTYKADGPEVLEQRLCHITQVLTRNSVGRMTLKEALVSSETVASEVLNGLREDVSVTMLGVEILGMAIVAVRPTPEMARALEAEAREALQQDSDSAIYDRRNAAVEQERRIRESELNTELAVEEKKRQIRESQMAADIAVEEQRAILIEQRVENERKEADVRAYALETILKPVRDVDWKTLMAVGAGSGDSSMMIAVAFRELAENASKIGELNVSPDLLRTLMSKKAG